MGWYDLSMIISMTVGQCCRVLSQNLGNIVDCISIHAFYNFFVLFYILNEVNAFSKKTNAPEDVIHPPMISSYKQACLAHT